jgi:hypothetical protein
LSLADSFFSSLASSCLPASVLSDFLSLFDFLSSTTLSHSSGQKIPSNTVSIQLFFSFGLASSISFHETSNVPI